jgi:hypothetical protein
MTLPGADSMLAGFIIIVRAPRDPAAETLDDTLYYYRVKYQTDALLNRLSVASGLPVLFGGWWHLGRVHYAVNLSDTETGTLMCAGETTTAQLSDAMAFLDTEVNAMRFALNRYRSSMAEIQDHVASATDIAIAWESMLMRGEASKAEVGFKLAVKAAHMVGGTSAERLRTFDVIKRTYDTRSSIVHDGGLSRDERETRRETLEATELFTIAARKLLRAGFPTKEGWKRMILGACAPLT